MNLNEWKEKWITGNKKKRLPPRWLLALDSHVAWGVAIPSFTGWVFSNYIFGAVLILFIDLVKEVFADPYFEGEAFWTDGLFDWLEYLLGVMATGVIAYLLASYFHLPLSWL